MVLKLAYLEAKGIFRFINLYLCNTGLDNQIIKFFFLNYPKKATVFTALWLVGTISFYMIL